VYSTCLFCHSNLGRNESIEHFPVGRRLAFDGAKGRLWVVCRKCERWNLSPLEERWEAIEESERAFRETRLRVSTDHIGLARLREGLELIRIGEPQRPEMAAWRYGDQFGRRRRKQFALVAGGVILVGGVWVAGPMVGLVGGGSFNVLFQIINSGNSFYRSRTRIPVPVSGGLEHMRLADINSVSLRTRGERIELEVPVIDGTRFMGAPKRGAEALRLHGDDAVRAASALLPRINRGGGSARDVSRAVDYLEETSDPVKLFHRAAREIEERNRTRHTFLGNPAGLKLLPTAGRLALEMATHEETERRALEGELHILEEAWKDAEEIAAIADDLLLPNTVHENLARLKRRND
jgi:hypothetical protein